MKYTIKGSFKTKFKKEITAQSLDEAWEIAEELEGQDIDQNEETDWDEADIDDVIECGEDDDKMNGIIGLAREDGEFNNRRKIKSRYVQLEKCYGFKYGTRQAKAFIDSPARYRRETRQFRKVIAQLFSKEGGAR